MSILSYCIMARNFKGGTMEAFRKWAIIGIALACLAGFTACNNDDPAEKAGKSIDKAMKDLKKKVE